MGDLHLVFLYVRYTFNYPGCRWVTLCFSTTRYWGVCTFRMRRSQPHALARRPDRFVVCLGSTFTLFS